MGILNQVKPAVDINSRLEKYEREGWMFTFAAAPIFMIGEENKKWLCAARLTEDQDVIFFEEAIDGYGNTIYDALECCISGIDALMKE